MKGSVSFDFNLALTNLFIGLVRGHRFLRPASQRVKVLGYRLFGVERPFVGEDGTVTPEAIACSEQMGHTLLTEWTALDAPDERKRRQIGRYLQVADSHLVESAGVPPRAANTNSTWLVVKPDSVGAFWDCVKAKHEDKLLVSSFRVDPECGICVCYAQGTLCDGQLAGILKDGIQAERVPMGYVRVSPNNLNTREFAEAVIQQFVSLVAKQRHEFSGEDLASGIFETWDAFGQKTREAITRRINELLKEIAKAKHCGAWLERVQNSPPRWQVCLAAKGGTTSMLRRLKGTSARLLAEVMDGQYVLDFGDEGE